MLVLLPDTIAFVYNFEHVFACLDVEAWEIGNGYRLVLSAVLQIFFECIIFCIVRMTLNNTKLHIMKFTLTISQSNAICNYAVVRQMLLVIINSN